MFAVLPCFPPIGIETDTRKLLKKVLDNKKQLAELKESGDIEKYAEIKKKQAWEKAMAKTSGQKVMFVQLEYVRNDGATNVCLCNSLLFDTGPRRSGTAHEETGPTQEAD